MKLYKIFKNIPTDPPTLCVSSVDDLNQQHSHLYAWRTSRTPYNYDIKDCDDACHVSIRLHSCNTIASL